MTDGILAFTGSRAGCTEAQRRSLWHLIRILYGRGYRLLHCGCAIGADETAATLARDTNYRVVGHPSDRPDQVSAIALAACTVILPAVKPLDRNRTMVEASRGGGILIACPSGPEVTRSGTWATVRWARKVGVPRWVVSPDGKLTREGETG